MYILPEDKLCHLYGDGINVVDQKKVNAENSSLKNKIKRLVRSSLFDTLTLDFVSLRAFDKIKLHVIYVLDGRHGF